MRLPSPPPSFARAGLAAALILVAGAGCSRPTPAPGGATAPAPDSAGTPIPAGTAGTGLATSGPTSQAAALATSQAAEGLPRPAGSFGRQGIDPGQIQLAFDVAVADDGSTFVSDSKGVQRFGADGEFVARVGGDALRQAQGIAIGPDGTLYVSGFGAQIAVFDAAGAARDPIGEAGSAPGQLATPVDVAVDGEGNLYVADAGNRRVEKFSAAGAHRLTIGERGSQSGQFTAPRAVAVDAQGRIYVGQGDDFLIQRFGPDGAYLDAMGAASAEENIWRIGGLALDEAGNLYASQVLGNAIQSFATTDTPAIRWRYGALGSAPGQFNSPTGLAVHGGRLYVADQNNHRVQWFDLP